MKAVEELDSDPERTTFTAIEFASRRKSVSWRPVRTGVATARMPLWLDPRPDARRERPSLSILMETRDGGATWNTNKISMFGRISQIRLEARGRGLGLIEFDDYFDFPSELFRLSGKVGRGRDESSGARISRLRISLQVPQHTRRDSNHRAQSSGARFRAKYGSRKAGI